jgi:hypothetical protein
MDVARSGGALLAVVAPLREVYIPLPSAPPWPSSVRAPDTDWRLGTARQDARAYGAGRCQQLKLYLKTLSGIDVTVMH